MGSNPTKLKCSLGDIRPVTVSQSYQAYRVVVRRKVHVLKENMFADLRPLDEGSDKKSSK